MQEQAVDLLKQAQEAAAEAFRQAEAERSSVPADEPAGNEPDQVQVTMGNYKGNVFVDFHRPVVKVSMTPEQARGMASRLKNLADALEPKRKRH